MKIIAALLAVLMLAGCGATIKRETVVETQYVVRKAIDEQKRLPPYPAPIDVTKATQVELAQWILENEERQWRLEALIAELIRFYERPVTREEREKLQPPVPAASAPAPKD